MKREEFEKLSVKARRVLLAKDVITQLKAGRIIPMGHYLSNNICYTSNQSAKEAFENNVCEVCAKAALVISWIKRFNSYKLNQLDEGQIKEVKDIFGKKLLDVIEAAFEGFTIERFGILFYPSEEDNHYQFEVEDNSMQGIMRNLIENNGAFKVTFFIGEEKEDYLYE